MKVSIDFWQVVITSYYGADKMVMTDIETYMTREEAVESGRGWLKSTDYVEHPETEDGTFPGRTFEYKLTTHNECDEGTIERVTDIPEEFFFRRVEIVQDSVTKDVPLVFDIKDITKVQFFTKDDDVVVTNTKKEVLDMIDDRVYRMKICDCKFTDCALRTRMINALNGQDIFTVGQLLKCTPSEVRKFWRAGVKGVEFLQKELREKYNINWV